MQHGYWLDLAGFTHQNTSFDCANNVRKKKCIWNRSSDHALSLRRVETEPLFAGVSEFNPRQIGLNVLAQAVASINHWTIANKTKKERIIISTGTYRWIQSRPNFSNSSGSYSNHSFGNFHLFFFQFQKLHISSWSIENTLQTKSVIRADTVRNVLFQSMCCQR